MYVQRSDNTVQYFFVDNDILFFPLNTTKDLSLHDLAFVRHRKKYLSRYGQCFLDTTVQFFQELDGN